MKVTLKLIAQETGVSQMTVSRILRGCADRQVSGEVRNRVVASLEKYGYDFQKSDRQMTKPIRLSSRKIIVVLPRHDYLENPPLNGGVNPYRILETYLNLKKLEYEYVAVSSEKEPHVPNWEELWKIPEGTPVLFFTSYNLTSAIALTERRCRVAIVLRDLFWRNYYAPQLKKMACYVLKTADGIAQAVQTLIHSGCRKIVCCAVSHYIHEPKHPVLSGYDYAIRVNNLSYRKIIPLTPEDNLRDPIRKAYEQEHFDGIFFAAPLLRNCRHVHAELGLPESVRIATVEMPEQIVTNEVLVNTSYSYDKIIPDAVENLLSDKFRITERSYRCNINVLQEEKITGKKKFISQKTGI